MQKQLLLGVEAIALGAIDAGISAYMLIRELRLQRLPNISRIPKLPRNAISIANGLPMKRPPWKVRWGCLMPGNVLWFV